MVDSRKLKLMDLGAEALADALLELAVQNERADDLVERLIAVPKENVKRFKSKLAGLKRRQRFVSWGESGEFARELQGLLQDLQAGVEDPKAGVELVAAFYEADQGTLGHCDDSSGHVGDVFRFEAKELFVSYAVRCSDKEWLGDLVVKLLRTDDYGVRDVLVKCATAYLPELVVRSLIKRFEAMAGQESEEFAKRHWLFLVESLARQVKDAPLFEKTRLAAWGSLSTAACIDIARVYLECADAQAALEWLGRISEAETIQANERDQLLLEIHSQLGNKEQAAATAWRIFRRGRSTKALDRLLAVLGQDQREAVLEGELTAIRGNSRLNEQDAMFLVEIDQITEAESYLLDRAEQLNGDFYSSLLPLAETMETEGRPLGATIVYRALLDSILRRGQTKTYAHGVRYLKKLDRLAKTIVDWRGFEDQSHYLAGLRQQHGRKSSFWSRYEG